MARKFNRSTNVLSSNFSSALDRNTGVNVMQRLSDLIAQVYSEDFYKFQSNTFFALVIAQTGYRTTDIRTARNTFSEMQYQRESVNMSMGRIQYPSCKVRILETGHAFIGDPTDPNGVFNYNRLDRYADGTRPNRLKALNVAFIDMHGFPAYTSAGITPPEYGDVVLVEVDNISDPKDIKILEIVATKIIEPLNFQTEDINPPTPLASTLDALPFDFGDFLAEVVTAPRSDEGILLELEEQFRNLNLPNLIPNDAYGKQRRFALNPVLIEKLVALAEETNTTIRISSAGQPTEEMIEQNPDAYRNARPEDASNRHDLGMAVDIAVYSQDGGNRYAFGDSADERVKDFVMAAFELGFLGIGAGTGYMQGGSYGNFGLIHLDLIGDASAPGQRTGIWGGSQKNRANAPQWLEELEQEFRRASSQPQASTSTTPQEAEEASA